jgi:outer membrane lipoprotein-sorting protein
MSLGENEHPDVDSDDARLARALGAMRRLPVPQGPSPEALARTLAAVRSAADAPVSQPRFMRRKSMIALFKVAAALLLAAGGAFFAASPFLVGAPMSFEEVAQKIQKAHTMSYVMTMQMPGQAQPQAVRLFLKEPGHMRTEAIPAGGPVFIGDSRSSRRLILNPADKTAMLLEGQLPGEPKPGVTDVAAIMVTGLRKLAEQKGDPAGEKVIAGVKMQGFRVVQAPGYETIIWADPNTRLPVQIDVSAPFGDQTMRGTMSDIQLDKDLDDSLFRMEPPEGYTLQKQNLADKNEGDGGSLEQAIVSVLKLYAENAEGAFPKKADDWMAYVDALKKRKVVGSPQADAIRMANLFARAQVFIMDRKGDYHYTPEGVRLGDAGKPLLWYKPRDKEQARVIYGDLHVAEAPPDRLPTGGLPRPKR